MSALRDRLLGVGAVTLRDTPERKQVACDDRYGVAGVTTEHWDGRLDAVVLRSGMTVMVNPRLTAHRAPPERMRGDMGAFGNSGLFYLTIRDILQNDTAVDLIADAIKAALFTNTKTPNFDTDASYNTTAEVTGTGYTAGGAAIANDTITVTSGTLKYDGDDTAWAGATLSGVRGTELYDDTITTPAADPLIVAVTFGADFAVTAGTLTIQWPAGGIFDLDLTP